MCSAQHSRSCAMAFYRVAMRRRCIASGLTDYMDINSAPDSSVYLPSRKEVKMIDKPRRPMSAYMLWLNSAREQIKSEHPGLKVTEIAKKGGEIWRAMKDKSVWEEKAAKAREQYTKDLESYNANGGGGEEGEIFKMYCHLCHVEASPTHDSSSGHHAARQLAAVAVDRLSNYVASEDSAEETPIVAETDKTVKTPEAVGFCDSCNVIVPVTELSSHLRMRNHALALLNEQTFEELVHAYVGEDSKLEPTDPTDDGAFVDETEAINTYTCHLCDLKVPQVFKTEHERGSWHRTSRTLTLAAARRARDTISARSDSSNNDHKFTGKMMKKLLKAYRGYDEDKSDIEDAKEDPEPIQPETKRLTAKQYFTDILPYLPYVGSFCSLIIDDTEFVTVQISNETLKIHVNNFNGLHHFEGNGGNYMNCRLCDGFNNTCYGSVGNQDKLHVMSLGHIKNVLSPVDSVHLIRKIDDTHSICGLCNMHIASHLVDNHILKDTRHTMALSEALERGKQYKENKENVKIMMFMPQPKKQSIFMKPNEFNNNNSRWMQPRHFSGTVFGNGQNTGFFGAQNTGNFSGQNTGFGSTQATGFGSTQNTGFASANTGFASVQNTCLGGAQSFGAAKANIFGAAQTQGHVTQKNTPAFGTTQNTAQNQSQSGWNNCAPTNQNTTTFGDARNNTGSFGSPQNSAPCFGAQNKNALFGNIQNNTATFGAAQPAQGNAPVNSGESQTIAVIGSTQNTTSLFGNAPIKDCFGVSPQKKADNVPDQINKAPKSWSVWDLKGTPTNDWNCFKSVNSEVQFNQPVQVVKKQDSTPISLHSVACGGDSQSTFGNVQSPSQKVSEFEQVKKIGEAQTQSKNEAYAQINKPISTIQQINPNYVIHSSSSSDSE